MRGIVIAFLLLFSLSAQGQFIIDSYRFGGGVSADLLLDSFPGAHSAYSLRKLDKDYAGNALVVQRDNGDTTAVGFVGNFLDTASMKTFCGTGAGDSCRVRIWYDQSGNGRIQRQDTAARQPLVMTNGAINYIGGRVAIDFNTSQFLQAQTATDWNFLHQSGKYFNFGVVKATNVADPNDVFTIWATRIAGLIAGANFIFDDRASLPANNRLTHNIQTQAPATVSLNALNDAVNPNTVFLYSLFGDAGNATAAQRSGVAVNANSFTQNNIATLAASTANATHPLHLGVGRNATGVLSIFFTGQMFEQIFYASDESSNRAAIETNINNFYSIY
jgi:hypothetical protein